MYIFLYNFMLRTPMVRIGTLWLLITPAVEENLTGRKFTMRNNLDSTALHWLNGMQEEEYAKTFKHWLRHLKRCVSFKGRGHSSTDWNIINRIGTFTFHLRAFVAIHFDPPSYLHHVRDISANYKHTVYIFGDNSHGRRIIFCHGSALL